MKSWNEIRKAATAFSKRWKDAYAPATGIETETITSSTGPTIIRRSLHGILLSTETSGETTFNSYDAFARVVATSRTGCQPVQDGSPIGALAASVLHLLPLWRPPRHTHLHQLH